MKIQNNLELNLIDSLTEYLIDAIISYKRIKYWVKVELIDYSVMQEAILDKIKEVTNDEDIKQDWIKVIKELYGEEWFKYIFEGYEKNGLVEEVIKNSIQEKIREK